MEGMRHLLKKENTDEMEAEFKMARETMYDQRVLKPFDDNLETVLVIDASRVQGVGFLLMQRRTDGVNKFNIIQWCGSYTTNQTQKRYSATELEMLGVMIACRKCHFYLQGLESLTVLTDHSALV